ncbi:MAG: cytochrome c [Gammaproteobacteria bacterium]|nr:cytochrome c [Gammaproteobacteria bacterium]MDH4314709.1 cytochrome c [Gammaproteobacteria bacterium]MDH5214559.1 cytochrome c [Gammaproteobacteria bacterium]MDH5499831.1 cytochrome c [Gammaproteobacteria bacterium]
MRYVLLAVALSSAAALADEALLEKGKYLVYAGGCITCHTEEVEGAVPLAGGHALKSPFGTFYAPNITPDTETGIGKWSDDDFLRAFHEGLNPDGDAYFPAFPYTSYTGMSREDLLAIKAYLFSLEPVTKEIPDHDLPVFMSSRLAARGWQMTYFNSGRFGPDETKSTEWNRGAYLVRHVGHCGECHTPRGRLGGLQYDKGLTGNPDGPDGESIPNITADPEHGIGRWQLRDIEFFLDIGMLPDGDFTGGSMSAVIDDNTSHLTPEDRKAIAIYLKSLAPGMD